ncbi:hypothetical protein K431DRAFT_282254 [Polychaeton citri CBS 116435]|uniref:Uncharacterized protein n=1 Tax=Polychaeton citri CBS 116435 TaxID=1314669 RepID=A0A9P4URJ9_9PEZI|nr:hypothetical protein K431DRAFT_282254 [Polychaeton citri CBS 116435]
MKSSVLHFLLQLGQASCSVSNIHWGVTILTKSRCSRKSQAAPFPVPRDPTGEVFVRATYSFIFELRSISSTCQAGFQISMAQSVEGWPDNTTADLPAPT